MAPSKVPERDGAYFSAHYTYEAAPKPKRKLAPSPYPVRAQPPSNSPFLGSGDHGGRVDYAKRDDGRAVAVKELSRDLPSARTEAKVMGLVKSEHVAKILDVIKPDERSLKLVLEYLPHTLEKHMEAGGALEEKQVWAVLAGAYKGAKAIHSVGYIHHDIAVRNVLASEEGIVKLADLGDAKQIGKGNKRSQDWRDIYTMGAELFEYVGTEDLSAHARGFMHKGRKLRENPQSSNPCKLALRISLTLANGLKAKTEF